MLYIRTPCLSTVYFHSAMVSLVEDGVASSAGRISLLSVLNLQTTQIICAVSQFRVIVTRDEHICIAPVFCFYFLL
jgi:hypothetical protein